MDDLISRQAAIAAIEFDITYAKAINKETGEVTQMFERENKALEDAVERVKQLPHIQPEPHTGHWEPVGMAEAVGGESAMWGSAIAYHKCSECGEQALEENGEEKLSDFCPSCGAKMEGVDDE